MRSLLKFWSALLADAYPVRPLAPSRDWTAAVHSLFLENISTAVFDELPSLLTLAALDRALAPGSPFGSLFVRARFGVGSVDDFGSLAVVNNGDQSHRCARV